MDQKTHKFPALDLLRGVAALIVMIYHYQRHTSFHLFDHGYLAVDFFFVLSGFVVSSAYEEKLLHSMSFARFMLGARILRLYPIFFLSTLLGALAHYSMRRYDVVQPLILLRELFLIPSFRSSLGFYPLNNVQWSILFELFANVAHSLVLKRFRWPGLTIITILSAAGIIACQVHYGSIDNGTGVETIAAGFSRVFFSYTVGIILFRMHSCTLLLRFKNGWLVASLVLVACLCNMMPKTSMFGCIADLLVVTVIFPILVAVSLAPVQSTKLNIACKIGGYLSYPVYLLQFPIFWMCHLFFRGLNNAALTTLSAFMTITLSAATFWFYDKQLRNRIGSMLRQQPRVMAASLP